MMWPVARQEREIEMILLHTSDWHIGMPVGNSNYREDQLFFVDELVRVIREEHVDAVVLAGDVFDSGKVSSEAIDIWNQAATKVCRDCGIPMIVIAGNHDSADRLAVCSELLKKSRLYIFGRLTNPVEPVLLDDGKVAVWPLPFFQSDAVRAKWPDSGEKAGNQTQAMQVVLDSIRERMGDYSRNIVVSHSLVSDAELSDSDRSARIGGASSVPVSVFDGFDYAALGHIHKPQRMNGHVRYSGSPMAYSFGAEEAHQKGFVLYDTASGCQRFVPIRQLHPHRTVTASREEIPALQKELENCWLNLSVTDKPAGPELYTEMRERFPYLAFLRGRFHGTGEMTGAMTGEELMKMSDTDIVKQFLADTESLVIPTERQLAWFEKTMLAEEEGDLQ